MKFLLGLLGILYNPIHRTAIAIILGGGVASPNLSYPDEYSQSWLGAGILVFISIIIVPWLLEKKEKKEQENK